MTKQKSKSLGANGNNGNEVGYCKPPKQSRFKSGRSGNPKDRPKNDGAERCIAKLLDEILDQTIPVREGKNQKRVSKRKAALLSLVNKAIQGHQPATRNLLNLMKESGISLDDEKTRGGVLVAPAGVTCEGFLLAVKRNYERREREEEERQNKETEG